ncbi:MAG: sigma-54 dependent transcriptional regulator [Gammaproteobacteria bacterium]|nr:sigma-54 dependent transcriptional regulator [Gammaproteobacteria bacterium]MCW8840218.1 sigma-54 dependent transcriptional regulator [Gammaproteobacteria bacterium]MCW8959543.1 sigma-54 dependent transcriptional regulator [Gammaproteobacteria bacterium]MCW8972140.1 sigma-54 dependent transcriptional regulator [Gammaproteobacteria bacterium]MCW8992299.1 sigma-54 dependent transcriptional regulator [Gammaproteobacteria bacterium]
MTSAPHILVIDDEPDIRSLLQEILEDEGYAVSTAKDAAHARKARRAHKPDLILLDIWMPDVDGITLLKEWIAEEPLAQPVIIMSGHGTVETAVEATRLGAYDYIEKPLSLAKLLLTIENALKSYNLQRENVTLRLAVQPVTEPIGRSRQFQHLRQQALQIAQHDTAVLLSGEPGSGKQLFARYLHNNSARRQGPFVVADITTHNPENETLDQLFGHERDEQVHYGLLEQANGGTLFIDDAADLDDASQSRLLKLLRHGQFQRHHGSTTVNADVRIITASRHSLEQLISQQRFREDLYYELNVVSLYIPALREHSDDVLDLIAYYSDYFVETDKLPYRNFTTAALNRLRQYSWPGNVRELKNLVQRLLIVGRDRQIDIEEVEEALGQQHRAPAPDLASAAYEMPVRQAREQFERSYFEVLMRRYEGSVNKVAQHAEMERTHLYRKLRSLGIDPKAFSR